MEEPHIHCDVCVQKICVETERYEQDECYEIDGYRMCADCIMPYLRKHHRVKLEDTRC